MRSDDVFEAADQEVEGRVSGSGVGDVVSRSNDARTTNKESSLST
jgi:hypothetical protein